MSRIARAEQLGVHHEALRTWIRQAQADRGQRTDLPTTTEVEELRRLRKETPSCAARSGSRRRPPRPIRRRPDSDGPRGRPGDVLGLHRAGTEPVVGG
jgi:transposase-like protein